MNAAPLAGVQYWPSRPRAWLLIALALGLWNGLTVIHANAYTFTQWYDGVQYQLLARNQLNGHGEVGDSAHTVGLEGHHPMWRPGLVWIERYLARLVGSMRTAAALASALGTTLLELATLWLAWQCFGFGAWSITLAIYFSPWTVGATFLAAAMGQGPEPWAAAAVVFGLAAVAKSCKQRSWFWAIVGGAVAGLAEWFRTGTMLLFAAPCGVVTLYFLYAAQWRRLSLIGPALASLALVVLAGGWNAGSSVNKTVVNFWHNLVETDGPHLKENVAEFGEVTFSMGGYMLVPGTSEVFNDHIVNTARNVSTKDFLEEKADVIFPLYRERLEQVFHGRAFGLRWTTGDVLLLLFLFQISLSIVRPSKATLPTLALAAGALAYYFGPVILLRGDAPSHYLLLALPFFVVVGAQGAFFLASSLTSFLVDKLPSMANASRHKRNTAIALGVTPLIAASLVFYAKVMVLTKNYCRQTILQQNALDDLHLNGRKVACRNMSWFVDRDVQTILLPYAEVPDLEKYVRARGIDGILIWEKETQVYFRAMPQGTVNQLDLALRKSPVFESPQVSGDWRYYPVRRQFISKREP